MAFGLRISRGSCAIRDHALTTTELLARLVALPSVSRDGNRALADFVCEYLDRPGLRLERFEDDGGRRVDVVARLGPETGSRGSGLVLAGHLDVVPADEPGWQGDPFRMIERDGKLFGRGTCDMKGFVALALQAARNAPNDLAAPLCLVFTRDEELGSLGAQALLRRWNGKPPLPQSVVVGEPTSLRVVRLHKGHVRLHVAIHGKSAHSGYPHRGDNAIDKAVRALFALGELRQRLEEERPPSAASFPEVPFVTLNVGRIRGGEAVNVVPDRCEIDLGLRPLPGVSPAVLIERVAEVLAQVLEPAEFVLTTDNVSPPMECAASAPVHRELARLAGRTAPGGVSFASDAGALAAAGLDTVLYGPGSIEVAHQPNEFVPCAELEDAANVIERAVRRFCVEGIGGGSVDA